MLDISKAKLTNRDITVDWDEIQRDKAILSELDALLEKYNISQYELEDIMEGREFTLNTSKEKTFIEYRFFINDGQLYFQQQGVHNKVLRGHAGAGYVYAISAADAIEVFSKAENVTDDLIKSITLRKTVLKIIKEN